MTTDSEQGDGKSGSALPISWKPMQASDTPDLASMDLAGLRRALAQARNELREADDSEKYEASAAEKQAIENAGGEYGKNDTDRKRFLVLALEKDSAYQDVLAYLRSLQARKDLLEADLEIRLDARRDREIDVRSKLADALLAVAAQTTAAAVDQVAEDDATEKAWERYVEARNCAQARQANMATSAGAELGG